MQSLMPHSSTPLKHVSDLNVNKPTGGKKKLGIYLHTPLDTIRWADPVLLFNIPTLRTWRLKILMIALSF